MANQESQGQSGNNRAADFRIESGHTHEDVTDIGCIVMAQTVSYKRPYPLTNDSGRRATASFAEEGCKASGCLDEGILH